MEKHVHFGMKATTYRELNFSMLFYLVYSGDLFMCTIIVTNVINNENLFQNRMNY
jgi:hypothetical protein